VLSAAAASLRAMRTLEDVLDQFAYHPATEDTAPRHDAIRSAFLSFAEQLWPLVPDGPEKTLVFRELQKGQMFANLAVALTAPSVMPGTKLLVREIPAPDRG
jgi:hypothetical protein